MTRINCIPPSELHTKHLVAEYRELPRVFDLAQAAYNRGECPRTHPNEYTLGTGHVKFFYTRLAWCKARHAALVQEMQARGYKPTYTAPRDISDMPQHWCHAWTPTESAMTLNRQRISERIPGETTKKKDLTSQP